MQSVDWKTLDVGTSDALWKAHVKARLGVHIAAAASGTCLRVATVRSYDVGSSPRPWDETDR
jgi:hypothetical protein